jgi:glycosyltransferase 2 family protein
MAGRRSHLRHTILLLAKLGLAAAILGYLAYRVQESQGFARLVADRKDWPILGAALICTFAAINLSFLRWHVLVNALGLTFRLVDAMRLGALGFALNFVSLGTVGGDLFRAILLAKEYPGRRTEAVATVMADRVLGLAMMMLLASTAILVADWRDAPPEITILCRMILVATVAGFAATGVLLFVPVLTGQWIRGWFERVPWVGTTAARLVGAVEAYRDQKSRLLLAASIGLVVDALFITSFFLVSRGLPVHAPTFAQHLFIVPVADIAGAIPVTPSGLGTLEAAVEALYQGMPGELKATAGDGILVALAHRLTMIAVAAISMVYYVSHRSELREALTEVEAAAEDG